MTKEQFVAVVERLATYAVIYAVGKGYVPVSMQADAVMLIVAGSSIAYGIVKNSRLGKVKAVERMPDVAAIIMNAKGSDLADNGKTGPKVVNGEVAKKIVEVLETPIKKS